ncbi:hypothetical protein K435DRAFT_778918 [Dendrothele bispora CBS 962.96]|uniref:Hydrophobin n=1 Tax=Dendrothele bispora (strain CBS 962.96) TaxID=1314807 RepID=A0A4S8M0K4_DENBC|nr:hypothetical protein K435DRAFT_780821 [Dendrothele bispora CBS 962.96]THU95584.1 hypothetical protein K435DRAFT_778918 [Dendrothele bispora CBS 962.96]
MYASKLFTTVTGILFLLSLAGVNAQSCTTDDDGPGNFICCEIGIDSPNAQCRTPTSDIVCIKPPTPGK